MINKEILQKQRKAVYKPTPLKMQLVDELVKLIKGCFGNDVVTTQIGLENNYLQLEGIHVKSLEIDPMELGAVLVHWYPNFRISTKNDPYCSIYTLNTNTIKKVIRKVEEIHQHYLNH